MTKRGVRTLRTEVGTMALARLEEIFERHGEDPSGESCDGMRGLLEEGAEMLEKRGDPDVIDAGIIAAAQRVEHYEIAERNVNRQARAKAPA